MAFKKRIVAIGTTVMLSLSLINPAIAKADIKVEEPKKEIVAEMKVEPKAEEIKKEVITEVKPDAKVEEPKKEVTAEVKPDTKVEESKKEVTTEVKPDTKAEEPKKEATVEVKEALDLEQLKKEARALKKPITIMYYCDADNDLEGDLLNDVQEMKKGVNDEINLITLVDRNKGYSSNKTVFGEDFADTRLYEIHPQKVKRVGGGKFFPEITTTSKSYEANMGDANTLKNFIDFSKENYPSDKYVLILSNHGGGPKLDEEKPLHKAICWDYTNNKDTLYTGEISDVLTKNESVDILGLDACFMGNAEFAYQFYKGNGGFEADTLVGCATSEWGNGWKYDNILDRLQTKTGDNGEVDSTLGGKEKYYSPKTATNAQIGAIIVEEQRDACEGSEIDQTLSCYDISKINSVKSAVDDLSVAIKSEKENIEKIRGDIKNPKIMNYFNPEDEKDQLNFPFFDLYDFAEQIKNSSYMSNDIKDKAKVVMDKVDDMVLYSYGGQKYVGFKDGKNGMTIFFPSGDSKIYVNRQLQKHFKSQYWYSPLDLTSYLAMGDSCYGKLKWCQDGQDKAINKVGNWFELLDSWYDESNDAKGGYNEYQW